MPGLSSVLIHRGSFYQVAGSSQPHNNMHPYTALNLIIALRLPTKEIIVKVDLRYLILAANFLRERTN